MKRLFLLLALAALYGTATHAQLVALKTNALMDAAMMPNLNVEITTGNKTSLDIGAMGCLNVYGQRLRTLGVNPSFRYWIGGRPMVHLFAGVGLVANTYDITWHRKRFKGDAVGAGLEFGYVKPLGRRWNMEVSGGTAVVAYYQHAFYKGDSYDPDTHTKNGHGFKILPYKLGLSFSYILK